MSTKTSFQNSDDFIVPLHMNGMQGRMLRLPSQKSSRNREILLIYGHHASLERMFGMAQDLSQYGNVTMPDLPGFGGMESFYKIGEKPTLNAMADYLAAFIKLRYKRRRITVAALSFGFIVVTRMLQRYPELSNKVDLLISIVGFVHKDDFKFNKQKLIAMKVAAILFSFSVPAFVTKYFILRTPFIKAAYLLVSDKHSKLKDADAAERSRRINFEVGLWKSNDIRTYMYTSTVMLGVDLCRQQINLPVYHIAVEGDRYFDNHIVEQHMKVIFSECTVLQSRPGNHVPSVIADANDSKQYFPARLRKILIQSV